MASAWVIMSSGGVVGRWPTTALAQFGSKVPLTPSLQSMPAIQKG